MFYMAKMRKFRRINANDETIAAFNGFELVSYGDMEIIVRRISDRDDTIVYWICDSDTYDELVSFFLEILPKARPDPMW